jgi:hypothetical protein
MGGILVMFSFNIKTGKREQYGKWFKKNEEKMRDFYAKIGATYRGTYVNNFGLAASDGIVMVEFSSFEDFDVLRELDYPEIGPIMMEAMEVSERGVATQIYENASDAFQEVVVRKHKGKRPA